MAKPKPMNETQMFASCGELLETGISEAIRHMKQPGVIEGKPCEVTLKVKITPLNQRADQFTCKATRGAKLAPFAGIETSIAAEIVDGEVVVGEHQPSLDIPLFDRGEQGR